MHFVAGPWFTVQRDGEGWQKLGQVWISDGAQDCQGEIEVKVELERFDDES